MRRLLVISLAVLLVMQHRSDASENPDRAVQAISAAEPMALRLGGAGSGEHGVGYVKMPIFLRSKSPEELEIMRGIKRAFDPMGILNPGKMPGEGPVL